MQLINQQVEEIVQQYLTGVHKKWSDFEVALQVDSDDLSRTGLGETTINTKNKEITVFKFSVNGEAHTLNISDVEDIFCAKYNVSSVQITLKFISFQFLHEGRYDGHARIIIDIDNDGADLSREQIDALIDLSLQLNDKQWFHELTEKYKQLAVT